MDWVYVYGRDAEIETITQFITHINEGGKGLFFIKGYSGIGKTTLIKKVLKDYSLTTSPFILEGKYDQFTQNPNSGINNALQNIPTLLSTTQKKVSYWRDLLIKNLDHNLTIIADTIPELEKIIGTIPSIIDDTPIHTTQRYYKALHQLISALASKDHPIILFLDDTHWIDQSSIDLLHYLTAHCHIPHFGIISAYRDNECDDDHRLSKWITTLKGSHELKLEGLSPEDIADQLVDIMKDEDIQIEHFAKLIHEKTHGNPFFTRQLIEKLYETKILFYDLDSQKWNWNQDQISSHILTDNVGELVAARIKTLSLSSQTILSYAAALGTTFTPLELTIITQLPDFNILLSLREAEQKAFISRKEGHHHLTEEYRFQHDRIQKSAYELIPIQEQSKIHLSIATQLYNHSKINPDQLRQYLFVIISNYIKSKELILTESAQITVAKLGLISGQQSKNMGGHSQAREYLKFGISLLTNETKISHRALYKDLLKHLSESEYLSNNLDKGEAYFSQALTQAQGTAERADVLRTKFDTLCHLNMQLLAVEDGIPYLKEFGVSIPTHKGLLSIKISIGLLRLVLSLRKIPLETLRAKTEGSSDTKNLNEMLFAFATCAYFADQTIFAYLITRIINDTLKSKFSSSLSTCLAASGILMVKINQFDLALRLGQFAIALSKDEANYRGLGKSSFIYSALLHYWKHPLQTCLPLLEDAHSICSSFGEISYTNFCINNIIAFNHFLGNPLQEISSDLMAHIEKAKKENDRSGIIYNSIMKFFIDQTMQDSPQPIISYQDISSTTEAEENSLNKFFFFMYKTQYLYILGLSCEIDTPKFKTHLVSGTSLFHFQEYQFYYALTLSRFLIQKSGNRYTMPSSSRTFKKLQKTFQNYAKRCPENFRHKTLFLSAEKDRIRHNYTQALTTYEDAYHDAITNGFLLNAALIKEESAKCAKESGNDEASKQLIQPAIHYYKNWGAPYKVTQLTQEFGL